jgi:hypothetical protein
MQTGCAVAGTVLAAVVVYKLLQRGPSEDEREALRRGRLAAMGRIIDGCVTDALPSERAPETIVYEYRIAGVGYECAQDVSRLKQFLGEVKIDLPVQVRYDPYNPADSIVVAESWNGLWHWEQRE